MATKQAKDILPGDQIMTTKLLDGTEQSLNVSRVLAGARYTTLFLFGTNFRTEITVRSSQTYVVGAL